MTLRYFNFIPVYNNPKTVVNIIERSLKSSQNPLLLIDDGSLTPVESLVEDHVQITQARSQKKLFIIRVEKNKGKGAALKKAISWGVSKNFTHMITIDADGQFFPEEISHIQSVSAEHPWDYILGERQFEENTPKSSVFGRSFSNMWVKLETGLDLSDTQTGFRCYPLFWAQNITSFRNRFAFELELIVKGIRLGGGARSIPVKVLYPEDRVTHFKKFKDNFSLTLLHTQLCTERVLLLIAHTLSWKKRTQAWQGTQSLGAQWGTKIIAALISVAGVWPAYFLLFFVSLFYFLFGHSARRALKDYWLNINPKTSFFKLQMNIFLNIYRFGQSLVDFYYVNSNESLQKEILKNFGDLKVEQTVLLSGHFGYWNLAAGMFSKFFKKDITTIEYVDPKANFEEQTYGKNHRAKISSHDSDRTVFSFYESQNKNDTTAGLIDRPTGERYELVRFFNKLMPIDTSLGLAAKTIKSDAAFFTLNKVSIAKYDFQIEPPPKDLNTRAPETMFLWASAFAEFYEKSVMSAPHSWANFYTPWKVHPDRTIPTGLNKKKKRKARHQVLPSHLV